MDESSALGVGTGGGRIPERTAEGDVAEVVSIDVGVGVGICACAVKRVARVRVAVQVREVRLDRGVACGGVCAEPGGIAGGRGRLGLGVRVGARRVALCSGCGSDELCLLRGRAADVAGALDQGGAGGGELAGEAGGEGLGLVGVDLDGGVVRVHVVELVAGAEGVLAGARGSEVVCLGD